MPLTSGRIQDPYSLRGIPQIHGGVFDALNPTRATLEIEINAATDNPLIFSGDDDEEAVLSGGNFHGHPLALACDAAKIAVASLGTISERRIHILVDGEDRGLPPCLVAEPGVNSGNMIAHYMSAGLVAENRVLAPPSSVDSIPVSGGIEDVNTMGATAARHYRQIVAEIIEEMIPEVAERHFARFCDVYCEEGYFTLAETEQILRAGLDSGLLPKLISISTRIPARRRLRRRSAACRSIISTTRRRRNPRSWPKREWLACRCLQRFVRSVEAAMVHHILDRCCNIGRYLGRHCGFLLSMSVAGSPANDGF